MNGFLWRINDGLRLCSIHDIILIISFLSIDIRIMPIANHELPLIFQAMNKIDKVAITRD